MHRARLRRMTDPTYPVPAAWARPPASTRPSTAASTNARSATPAASGWNRRSGCNGYASRRSRATGRSARRTSTSLVRGRRAQRQRQLHRPAPRRRAATTIALIWEPDEPSRGAAPLHLSRAPPRGLPLRQRPEGAGRRQGRPGHDLSADDPGSGVRDARLRADRRDPFGRVRRLLARGAGRPDRGLRSRSWSSPPTRAGAAASACR